MRSYVTRLALCIALISASLGAQQWVMHNPPVVSGASFVYDHVSQRMVLFGGRDGVRSFD